MDQALAGAVVFDGRRMHAGKAVLIRDARILALIDETEIPRDALRRQLGGGLLAAGFVDLQVNGGGGALLNATPTAETVRTIAQAHLRHGTVALLPTVITDGPDVIAAAAAAVAACGLGCVPGLHIEGPHLDPVRAGAHDPRYIRPMGEEDLAALLTLRPAMVTLAPGQVQTRAIAALAAAGIRVSLGHSDCGAGDAAAAFDAGASAVTHLFNAMSQMRAREPGLVGAALGRSSVWCGLIADGIHVADDSIRAAFQAKSAEHLFLVSDAMPAAAGGPDRFTLQGRAVSLANGRLTLADGTLAGSAITLAEAVRHCIIALGLAPEAVLAMASRTPAAFLGLEDHGVIAPGAMASLVHLDDGYGVRAVWQAGLSVERGAQPPKR